MVVRTASFEGTLMRTRLLLLVAVACALLVACGDKNQTPSSKPAPSTSPSASATTPAGVDKVLVTVIENKSFDQLKSKAPKIWALGQKYGYATDFRAITHPSLPNYIAMAAGSTLGVEDDDEPVKHQLTEPNVFADTIAAGRTAQILAEGMGSEPCRLTESDDGNYVPKHVPWAYFVNDRDSCEKGVVDASAFDAEVAAGDLPNVGLLIPNQCHNAHDCSLGTADEWISAHVEQAMTGPDWTSGRLAIVITADEDNRKSGNQILTIVVHRSQKHHVVSESLDLYSLHRLLAQVGGTEPLGEGRTAPDMAKAFGLPLA